MKLKKQGFGWQVFGDTNPYGSLRSTGLKNIKLLVPSCYGEKDHSLIFDKKGHIGFSHHSKRHIEALKVAATLDSKQYPLDGCPLFLETWRLHKYNRLTGIPNTDASNPWDVRQIIGYKRHSNYIDLLQKIGSELSVSRVVADVALRELKESQICGDLLLSRKFSASVSVIDDLPRKQYTDSLAPLFISDATKMHRLCIPIYLSWASTVYMRGLSVIDGHFIYQMDVDNVTGRRDARGFRFKDPSKPELGLALERFIWIGDQPNGQCSTRG